MARRKESGIEVVASMPWQVGIASGLVGYVAIRYGVGWYFSAMDSPFLSRLGRLASNGSFAPLAWIFMGGCWLAAFSSFLGRVKRRKLFDRQTGRDSISQISWREFEMLAGEAFRRQGYSVQENGLGGADGGIDLTLRRDGIKTLVQCKQWRSLKVDVKVAREMYGVLIDEGADALKIVALGEFTPDARRFVQGKPIELIQADALVAQVRQHPSLRSEPRPLSQSPAAFVGAVLFGLLLIALMSQQTIGTAQQTLITVPQAQAPSKPPAAASPVTNHASPTRPIATNDIRPAQKIVIQDHLPQTDQELRDWKRKNAEAMKILEKTTPQMQYR